jgi:hypothetical protein
VTFPFVECEGENSEGVEEKRFCNRKQENDEMLDEKRKNRRAYTVSLTAHTWSRQLNGFVRARESLLTGRFWIGFGITHLPRTDDPQVNIVEWSLDLFQPTKRPPDTIS